MPFITYNIIVSYNILKSTIIKKNFSLFNYASIIIRIEKKCQVKKHKKNKIRANKGYIYILIWSNIIIVRQSNSLKKFFENKIMLLIININSK